MQRELIHITIDELRSFVSLVNETSASDDEQLVRLHLATRFLFSNPVIGRAIDAIGNDMKSQPDYDAHITSAWLHTHCQAIMTVGRFGEFIDKHITGRSQPSLKEPFEQADIMGLLHRHAPMSGWRGDTTIGGIMTRLTSKKDILNMSTNEVIALSAMWEKIVGAISRASDSEKSAYQESVQTDTYLTCAKTIQNALIDEFYPMYKMRTIINSRYDVIHRLQDFHRCMSDLEKGNIPDCVRWDPRSLRAGFLRIAMQIQAKLASEPLQEHLISRLVAYLERFNRDSLIERLERENTQEKKNKQYEEILQKEVDRFLFMEGVFPITHCEASNKGTLDTWVENHAAPFISDEKREGLPPLLLELKQEIDLDDPNNVTEGKVATKAKDAQAQAREYQRHMQSKSPHFLVRVFPIVVYNGHKRFSCNEDGVILAYIGNTYAARTKPSTVS